MITKAKSHWIEVTRWAALDGDWDLSETSAHFKPPSPAPANVSPLGLAICDERFRDGLIRVSLRFEGGDASLEGGSAGIVLGYHAELGGYLIAGLGAFDTAYCIWEFVPTVGWLSRSSAGKIHNLQYGRDYDLKVTLKGQRIALTVDDVPVLEHLLARPLRGNQLGMYAMSQSPVALSGYAVERRPPMAFVAMQFGDPYDNIYRTVIRPTAKKLDFEVLRIDEINRPGIIFHDIQRKIQDAKVVIAEITAPNQNVYYEIGYAHALNKPTILLAERGKELPFGIRSYQVIFYENSIAGKPLVERMLREHLHSILQEI